VLDGLESASAEAGGGLKRKDLDRIISALRSRVFLLHNVHEDRPVIFQTRWAMSYLRGPLTRTQVRDLMANRRKAAVPSVSEARGRPSVREGAAAAPADTTVLEGYSSSPPSVSPDMSQVFLPLRLREKDAVSALSKELGQSVKATESTLVYEPQLLALGQVSFVDRKRKVDQGRQVALLVPPEDVGATSAWEEAAAVELDARDLENEPEAEALFRTVPSQLSTASKLKALEKVFGNHLFDSEQLDLYHSPVLNLYGQPVESEKDFALRAQQVARERRDAEVDKLRDKYEKKLDRLEERMAREEQELAEDRAEYEGRKGEELLSAGETVVGMLGIFGRRSSRSLSTAARKRRMTTQARGDVQESEEQIKRLEEEIKQMTQEMEKAAQPIADKWEDAAGEIQTYTVKPRRSDIKVELVTLAWAPYWEIGYASALGQVAHGRVPAY